MKRFSIQLENSGIKTKHTLRPDFSWAKINVDKIINKYFSKKFILLFPFCSPKLSHKKWPYYNDLIKVINLNHPDIEIAIAPGPSEIDDANKINATVITNNNYPLNIMQLADLITKSSFVIANDTGPAHMTAHLGQEGIVLFGHHTSPEKVSIETNKFLPISVNNLRDLTVEKVYSEIKNKLKLIN